MKKATKLILTALSERGYRITKARMLIIEAMAGSSRPVTISELAQSVSVDEASVYRTIETLRQKDLIEEIAIKGNKSKYSLVHNHHHHAVCRDCGYIEHVDCTSPPRPPKNLKNFSKVDDHDITFYGLCEKCS